MNFALHCFASLQTIRASLVYKARRCTASSSYHSVNYNKSHCSVYPQSFSIYSVSQATLQLRSTSGSFKNGYLNEHLRLCHRHCYRAPLLQMLHLYWCRFALWEPRLHLLWLSHWMLSMSIPCFVFPCSFSRSLLTRCCRTPPPQQNGNLQLEDRSLL